MPINLCVVLRLGQAATVQKSQKVTQVDCDLMTNFDWFDLFSKCGWSSRERRTVAVNNLLSNVQLPSILLWFQFLWSQ